MDKTLSQYKLSHHHQMSPYDPFYNRKPVFGLTYYGVPGEDLITIPLEDDLNTYNEYVSLNMVCVSL